jgi:hypothetical protein
MGRTLTQVLKGLPKERRSRINARYRELKREVESLRELRAATGKAQTEIAAALKIKQPSVSKLERQADMYLSTLRSYIEAIGGDLELVVHLPLRAAVRLNRLGDVFATSASVKRRRPSAKSAAAKRRA